MNCFTSTFIIDSVKPEDAGDVMFLVLNIKGIDQALISVNVTYSSSSSSSSSTSYSSILSTSSSSSTPISLHHFLLFFLLLLFLLLDR